MACGYIMFNGGLMPTASFDRNFDIRDTDSAILFDKDLHSPRSIKAANRDYASDDEKGIQLLRQRISSFQTKR
jgi:phage FluMu protein gp41